MRKHERVFAYRNHVPFFFFFFLIWFCCFLWFCPCFQCEDGFVYPHAHFPYRDNDMIFRILDLLSNSHAAVVNGRAFEFEPTRIEHFIDNCLHASCSILCGIHSADETQSGRKSCAEFFFFFFHMQTIFFPNLCLRAIYFVFLGPANIFFQYFSYPLLL